jgi:hypothetical protein
MREPDVITNSKEKFLKAQIYRSEGMLKEGTKGGRDCTFYNGGKQSVELLPDKTEFAGSLDFQAKKQALFSIAITHNLSRSKIASIESKPHNPGCA